MCWALWATAFYQSTDFNSIEVKKKHPLPTGTSRLYSLRSSTAFCLLLCYCVEPIVEWSRVTKTKPWSRLLYGDRGIKGQHRTKSFPSNVFSQIIFNHICHIYQTENHENHADAHSALFMPTDYGWKVNFVVVFALSLAENRDKKSWNFSLDLIMKCLRVLWDASTDWRTMTP